MNAVNPFKQLPLLLLLAVLVGTNESRAEVLTIGRWKIEVTAFPDKPSIMLGEPTWISFKVVNLSDEELGVLEGGDYRNSLGRPESFSVQATNAGGKPVPQPDAGPGFGGIVGIQKLPAKGDYTFRLFLPHWALFEEPGTYTITCQRILSITDSQNFTSLLSLTNSTGNLAIAHTSIKVTPADSTKMGLLITNFGNAMIGPAMLNNNWGKLSESPAKQLEFINDERAVPYWREVMTSSNHPARFTALSALSRFNSDEALEVIKVGMTPQSAEQIRHAAAEALRKSPHPRALPFLLQQRADPAESVRITVLYALGTMKPAEAIPILREMAGDKSRLVSDEARRYLGLRLKKEREK
jgi:hypothetical protein